MRRITITIKNYDVYNDAILFQMSDHDLSEVIQYLELETQFSTKAIHHSKSFFHEAPVLLAVSAILFYLSVPRYYAPVFYIHFYQIRLHTVLPSFYTRIVVNNLFKSITVTFFTVGKPYRFHLISCIRVLWGLIQSIRLTMSHSRLCPSLAPLELMIPFYSSNPGEG